MHLVMILLMLAIAGFVRLLTASGESGQGVRPDNFHTSSVFCYFLLPPLLLLSTAIAIVCMGPEGEMLGLQASWISYLLAWSYLLGSFLMLLNHTYQVYVQSQKMANYTEEIVLDKSVYLIETDFPYCAQIGLWQSKIIMSRGLLKSLNEEELRAVIAHEEAHAYYLDNLCFFGLGWLRTCSSWLPYTSKLWQQMLTIRELRADYWSAQRVDKLILAQALLNLATQVNSYLNKQPDWNFAIELSDGNSQRLAQRVEALLTECKYPPKYQWCWLSVSLLPLLTILLHS